MTKKRIENIFRAYDIRGIYGETLTDEIMERIGAALGEMFKGKAFAVGKDIRASGEKLAAALIAGLEKNANVTYFGTTAFGETLLAGRETGKDITLFITASHLPPEWNGLKMYYGDGEAFTSDTIYELRDRVVKSASRRRCFCDDYVTFMKNNFNISKELKVVIDCGNGSTCLTAPKVFDALGFETVVIHGNVDPKFPARTANIKPKLLTKLKERVLAEQADFGVAFDGDGDRFALVNEKGNIIRSDRTGLLLAKHMLARSDKDKVIITLPVSIAAETQLKPLGADVIRVPVGHTYVINGCKKNNALIGMEESGHLVLPDYALHDDALFVPLKVAEIMCETGKSLSELSAEIPNYPFEEVAFECSDDRKFEFIEMLARKLASKYENVSTLDGLRIGFDDGWALIRASNTSPKVRLYVEATTEDRFKELKDKFVQIIEGELKNG